MLSLHKFAIIKTKIHFYFCIKSEKRILSDEIIANLSLKSKVTHVYFFILRIS